VSLANPPYENPKVVEFALFDFDEVEKDNIETGIVVSSDDVDSFKAHACDASLRRRKFKTRLVERRFDATFRLQDKESALAPLRLRLESFAPGSSPPPIPPRHR